MISPEHGGKPPSFCVCCYPSFSLLCLRSQASFHVSVTDCQIAFQQNVLMWSDKIMMLHSRDGINQSQFPHLLFHIFKVHQVNNKYHYKGKKLREMIHILPTGILQVYQISASLGGSTRSVIKASLRFILCVKTRGKAPAGSLTHIS